MLPVIRDWIEQAAARHGDDVYLADARGPAALTYAGLLDIVRETRAPPGRGGPAAAAPGSTSGSPTRSSYATALVALIAAGRVAVPLDPGAPDTDVARVLGVARPAGVVTGRRRPPAGAMARPTAKPRPRSELPLLIFRR